jgi:hypothetical protein
MRRTRDISTFAAVYVAQVKEARRAANISLMNGDFMAVELGSSRLRMLAQLATSTKRGKEAVVAPAPDVLISMSLAEMLEYARRKR